MAAGKKKKKGKPVTKKKSNDGSSVTVAEKAWYEPDPTKYTNAAQKNDRLADLLTETWNTLEITSIRRIEIGGKGWEAMYRTIG